MLQSIRSNTIIQFLRSKFAYFGFCGKLITDNGVQFTSEEFAEYLSLNGVVHIKLAVYNP